LRGGEKRKASSSDGGLRGKEESEDFEPPSNPEPGLD